MYFGWQPVCCLGTVILLEMIAIAFALRHRYQYKTLHRIGREVEGKIIKKTADYYMRRWHFRITYSYANGDGYTFARTRPVIPSIYEAARRGKPIRVLYLPQNPGISTIPENTMPFTQSLVWVIAWAITLLLMVLMGIAATLSMS